MSLKNYQKKRDFTITKEPPAKKLVPKKAKLKKQIRIFVIHKHAARHLHYDLRLEFNGVLKSWAVPKGVSKDPNVKRLAIEVEDHPLEYAKFEGTIPKGQYGAGKVGIWDQGTWECDQNFRIAHKKGDIGLIFKGKKLKGSWKLIKLKATGLKNGNHWLLFKQRDPYAKKS